MLLIVCMTIESLFKIGFNRSDDFDDGDEE